MYLSLFGGELPWCPQDWIASDDTVRGGHSYSRLDFDNPHSIAVFNGFLDIKTLGGAGFASQHTTGEDKKWDLSNYDGIALDIWEGDGKKYTFSLKDLLLPPTEDGREQSVVSWDHDFTVSQNGACLKLYWSDFKPTFRGKEHNETAPLNLSQIRRFSLMIRSFFGFQEGTFSMSVASISAFTFPGQSGSPDEKYGCVASSISENFIISESSQRSIKMIE